MARTHITQTVYVRKKTGRRETVNENYTIFKTQGTNEIEFIAFSRATTEKLFECFVQNIHVTDVGYRRMFRIN